MWVWTPLEVVGDVSFPVAPEHRRSVFIAVVIWRRENGYDTRVAAALAVCAIPIHNLNQQELQVTRRRIRRTQLQASDVRG